MVGGGGGRQGIHGFCLETRRTKTTWKTSVNEWVILKYAFKKNNMGAREIVSSSSGCGADGGLL
jgi:hypothetical protein